MNTFDVAIVGGGAAGLACAAMLCACDKKLKIIVIDAGERLGKKLSSTGNGQGNVTNRNMSIERYFGGNSSLVERICCAPENLGIESSLFHCVLTSDDSGRCYPGGRQASALVDSLMNDLKRGGVEVRLSTKVVGIDSGFYLTLSDGDKLSSDYVVFCPGGKAQKQFKTDGSAYSLVEKFGHKVTGLYPSLVQLKTDVGNIRTLKGIRVYCRVKAFQNGVELAEKRGDVIFTDYGVSGSAIFEISPYVTDRENVTLSLEFLPDETDFSGKDGVFGNYRQLVEDIRLKKSLGYPTSELLSGTLHNQLGRAVIKRCASDDENKIAYMVKHFTLEVRGNLGFDYAQVTKGGIEMSGITDELESKYAANLFFAGEVLDVDGECGGYNLHWAFSSAKTVANAILNRIK